MTTGHSQQASDLQQAKIADKTNAGCRAKPNAGCICTFFNEQTGRITVAFVHVYLNKMGGASAWRESTLRNKKTGLNWNS